MPTAIEDSSRDSAQDKISGTSQPSKAFTGHATNPREAMRRLTHLLHAAPIDLAAICNEVRTHRELDALIMRLADSLVLSPDEPLSTLEEAVVVLGTERLRVLMDLWWSAETGAADVGGQSNKRSAVEAQKQSGGQLRQAATPSSLNCPEMRYLTNFLRCLGFDSPERSLSGVRLEAWASKVSSDQMLALTDLFMRDFFSLLPVIQPTIEECPERGPSDRH
jgi:hypothetical protein